MKSPSRSEVPVVGNSKPIPVSLDGFSGEVADVLKFDLYVQGFSFVAPDAAQYQISGSSRGQRSRPRRGSFRQEHDFFAQLHRRDVAAAGARVCRRHRAGHHRQKRHRADQNRIQGPIQHAATAKFTSPILTATTRNPSRTTIPLLPRRHGCRASWRFITHRIKLGNPDIFYHNLGTGQRRVVAGYSGLNTSAAVSPDGSKVAMILSKSGSPDVWVCDADGSNLKQLTATPEDESSPCWSPDGQWICFATKINERRVLAKVPAGGGAMQRIPTPGAPNPTEPDWSPDGKWIAFTSQTGEFDICVVPADGGTPTVLVAGEDPSWSPNSRTLIFARRTGGRYVLSVLDVFTKQVKDIARISGSDSQPAWAR